MVYRPLFNGDVTLSPPLFLHFLICMVNRTKNPICFKKIKSSERVKNLKMARPLFRLITNQTCHQMPNQSYETVPLKNSLYRQKRYWQGKHLVSGSSKSSNFLALNRLSLQCANMCKSIKNTVTILNKERGNSSHRGNLYFSFHKKCSEHGTLFLCMMNAL